MSHALVSTPLERKLYAVGKSFSLEVRAHFSGDIVVAYMKGNKGDTVITWVYVWESGTQNHRKTIDTVTEDEMKLAFVSLIEKAILREKGTIAREKIVPSSEIVSLLS